jgi:hypothetical protein
LSRPGLQNWISGVVRSSAPKKKAASGVTATSLLPKTLHILDEETGDDNDSASTDSGDDDDVVSGDLMRTEPLALCNVNTLDPTNRPSWSDCQAVD